MVSLGALGTALALVALGELGDKTQLVVISLSTQHSRRAVLLGAIAAEVLMAALAVAFGYVLILAVPVDWVQAASGISFVLIGAYMLVRKPEEGEPPPPMHERTVFASTFGLVAAGELGDKTQIAIIALAASTQAPGEVFVGACLALVLMMGIAVAVGDRLARVVGKRTLHVIAAALFLVAGALLLVGVALA